MTARGRQVKLAIVRRAIAEGHGEGMEPAETALLSDPRVDSLIAALAVRAGARPAPGGALDGAGALCRDLAEEFRRHLGSDARGVGDLPDRLGECALSPEDALASFLSDGTEAVRRVAERTGVDEDVLAVFAVYWMRPFVRARARSGGVPSAAVREPCPCCGSPPVLGRLRRGDGARFVWCAACGTEWRTGSIRCPFCGNEEGGTTGHFEVAGESRVRVDWCGRCRGYVKVVDERRIAGEATVDYDAFLWSSVLYDLVAEDRGLRAGGPADRAGG